MRFPAVVAVVVGIAVAILLFPQANQARLRSTDFVNFYAVASIVARGDAAKLYNRDVQGSFIQSISGLPLTNYFLHPPFEPALLAPLALLPFRAAYIVWAALNAALVAALSWLFASSIPVVRHYPFLGLSGYFFLPVLVSVVMGQDCVILLAIIAAAYMLLRHQRPFCAGIVLSLTAVKFHYLIILAGLLLLAGKRRLVLGVALGATALLVISAIIVGPRGLISYLVLLRDFDATMGYGSMHLDLMVSLRGFLAGVGSTSQIVFWLGEIGLAAMGILWSQSRQDESLQFAAFVTVSLLISPHAHFFDATVLLLPALIVIDRATVSSRRTLLLAITAALFVVPPVLLAFGGHYWWNSRIYLFFLVGLAFLLAISGELMHRSSSYSSESKHPVQSTA